MSEFIVNMADDDMLHKLMAGKIKSIPPSVANAFLSYRPTMRAGMTPERELWYGIVRLVNEKGQEEATRVASMMLNLTNTEPYKEAFKNDVPDHPVDSSKH